MVRKKGFSREQIYQLNYILQRLGSNLSNLKREDISNICREIKIKENRTNARRIRHFVKRRNFSESPRPLRRPKKINSGEFDVQFKNKRTRPQEQPKKKAKPSKYTGQIDTEDSGIQKVSEGDEVDSEKYTLEEKPDPVESDIHNDNEDDDIEIDKSKKSKFGEKFHTEESDIQNVDDTGVESSPKLGENFDSDEYSIPSVIKDDGLGVDNNVTSKHGVIEDEDASDRTSESSELSIYKGFKTVDGDLKFSDDHQSISTETLESIFRTKLLGEKFFMREIEESGSFNISDDDWSQMVSMSKGRQLKRGSLSHIILNGVKRLNPFCVFMIKRHYINISRIKAKKTGSRLVNADLYCKFKDCSMKCRVEMISKNKADVRFSGKIKHDLTERAARPISGPERRKVRKEFMHGQKPYRYYLKKFHQIPDDVKIAGNFSSVGSSPEVIRKIATEAKKCHALDPEEWTSLLKMTTEDTLRQNRSISGFIQHISIMPSYIMYWSETSVRLWHQLAKNSTAYWDATGSIISTGSHNCNFLYYELALANPDNNTKSPSIPITCMISSSHDKPQIQYWLAKFRQSEKQLYGHGNAVTPRQINSDRSFVFIQSALAEFSGETLDTFRTRAWRILNGLASEADIRKTIPHGCLSHVMKDFRKLCTEHYKSNFEYGMFLFGVLVNVDSLETATKTLTALLHILMSRYTTDLVKESASYIDMRIKMLPDNLQPDTENVKDTSTDKLLSEKEKNPNYFSEDEYILQKKGNKFSEWAYKIKTDVLSGLPIETSGLSKNKRYSKELADAFLRRFISLFPIWSNVLLGDLSRYINKEMSRTVCNQEITRKTNATIEQRFRVLKDVYFSGQTFSRLDVFSKQLSDHFEAVQKLIAIDQLKPTKRYLKKAKEISEEKWQKSTPKIDLEIGKYQKRPSKTIETFPKFLTKKIQNIEPAEGLITEQTSQNSQQNDTTRKYPVDERNPPAYNSQDMIHDFAKKRFNNDSLFANVKSAFASDAFLRSIYNDIARRSLCPNLLEKFRIDRVGLPNLGNTCWLFSYLHLLSVCLMLMTDVAKICHFQVVLKISLTSAEESPVERRYSEFTSNEL